MKTENEFERTVEASPAFDRRHADHRKNYGTHGVDLTFLLKGAAGVVQFTLYTNWQLPHVRDEQLAKLGAAHDPARHAKAFFQPLPADVGYHSPKPIYDGQEPFQESCERLDGRPCYYDGSGLNAQRIYEVLVAEGSDGVWRELEAYYESTFDGGLTLKGADGEGESK